MTKEPIVSVDHAAAKAASAVGLTIFGIGIQDWAAILAAIYSGCLLAEWLWKKFGRPFAESQGWVKRKARRKTDVQGP